MQELDIRIKVDGKIYGKAYIIEKQDDMVTTVHCVMWGFAKQLHRMLDLKGDWRDLLCKK